MSVNKIIEEKSMLRDHYKKMRTKMSSKYKHDLDLDIASRFLCSEQYSKAKLLLAYVSKETEIETRGIIYAALANNKRVAVPRCESEGKMSFYYIDGVDSLVMGKNGILEPDPDKCTLVTDFSSSLCIVPGYSFDPAGNRLGYGGGYYDRFLSDYQGVTVGLCYSSFIKWNIPCESHDVPVSVIATDGYIRRASDK